MQATGAKLLLVDMRGPGGPTITDLADNRHPNDAGYVKMAKIWFQGIQEAIAKDLLSPPANSSTSVTTSNGSGSIISFASSLSSSGLGTATQGFKSASGHPTSLNSGPKLYTDSALGKVVKLVLLISVIAIVF